MNILQRFGSWFRSERRETSTFENPGAWLINGAGGLSSSGALVSPDSAMRVVAVYACVRLISEAVASLPLHLYRRLPNGGQERAYDHPLYDILRYQPNPLMTAADMTEARTSSRVLRGRSIAKIVRGLRGQVIELIPINIDRVKVRPSQDKRSLIYEVDGGKEILRTGEVWDTLGYTLNGLDGVSPITYARETIGLALAAEEHGSRTFANAARPSGVLSHPAKLTTEATAKLAASWTAAHSGNNIGKAAVLEEGMSWTPLTMTATDAQYIETRKFTRTEIAALFRVPPHMIGDLDRATFSNIEHQSIDLVRYTIRPWLIKDEQTILRDLLLPSERGQYFAEYNVEGLLRGDLLTRMRAAHIKIQNGISSPNDIRLIEGENPREGGDVYLTPLNMAHDASNLNDGSGDNGTGKDASAEA